MKSIDIFFLIFISIFSFSKSYGQDSSQNLTTSYNNLKRVKVVVYVPDSLENEKTKTNKKLDNKQSNKRTTYSVNENKVSKEYFEKYY